MSIYILEAFIYSCKENGVEPSWEALKEFRKLWRD